MASSGSNFCRQHNPFASRSRGRKFFALKKTARLRGKMLKKAAK
jgi:hypothetical protein